MRRTLPMLITATMLLAACGSDAEPSGASDSIPPVEESATPVDTETPAESVAEETSASAAETTETTTTETTEVGSADPDLEAPTTNPDKPTDIAFPGVAPEELVVTVLEPGSGSEAVAGDTVIVDYIGVRSLDGVEFDNSYDRFTPFPVGPLGEANVIQGWNDGLLGAQTGARIQLDIPSELAYGETARDETIRENEPLTFVIDVRAVISPSDPAAAPTEPSVDLSTGVDDVVVEDLIEGDGDVLESADTAVFNYVLFRGDNGVALESTWGSDAIQFPMTETSFPGLIEGMPGMKVGGRRAITIPPALSIWPDGNPTNGLPAETDIIMVVDLLGLY